MADDERRLYHLRLVGQLHGEVTQNGYWFREANEGQLHDDEFNCWSIVQVFNSNIMPWIKDFACTEWHGIGLVCATMKPRYGPIVESAWESLSGNQLGEALPGTVAAVLSLRTGFGGRNRLGRSFYAGIGEVDHQGGKLSPDSHARLKGVGDALLDNFNHTNPAHVFHYGVYSPKLGNVPVPGPGNGALITNAGFTPITQTIPKSVLGTCRKRKLGYGI